MPVFVEVWAIKDMANGLRLYTLHDPWIAFRGAQPGWFKNQFKGSQR